MIIIMNRRAVILLNGLSILLLVGSIATAVYFYFQYKHAYSANSATSAQEMNAVLASVSKLMELPQNEMPTVATVTDVKKLTAQDFFKKAQNGDKVLIFQKALRAILYRPSINKIIEVGPIKLDSPAQVAGASTVHNTNIKVTPATLPNSSPVKIALYNGSTLVGATATVEAKLTSHFPDYQVVSKTGAQRRTYDQTLVVDVKGNKRQQAQSIADFLGGVVALLPPGEATPGAEIMIIVGNK